MSDTPEQLPAIVPGGLAPLDDAMPDEWKLTPAKEAMVRSNTGKAVKHGLLSSIPMICRDTSCPYKDFCVFQQQGMVKQGDRCIKEISEITQAADEYYREFDVDPMDVEHRVDRVQIEQLIFTEVMIKRCEMLLAKGDIVETIDIAFSPDGQDILQQPQLHKAAEALPKYQKRHTEILNQLMATRKDKAALEQTGGQSIDKMLAQMLLRAQQVSARQQMMRDGKHEEAIELGFTYGIESHPVDDVITYESEE